MCSRFFVSSACRQHASMQAARKRGVQALHVECPVQGCGWQWRHTMRCTMSSNTRTSGSLTSAQRNGAGARRGLLSLWAGRGGGRFSGQ